MVSETAQVGRRSDHVQLEFVVDSQTRRLDCCDVATVPFEVATAVRVPASWQHKTNYCGYYWAATVRRHVWFESLYERSGLMRIDRNATVVGIAAQPMWIHWSTGPAFRHAPDYFVRYADGGAALVDVRPAERLGEDAAAVFGRTGELCERLGWAYAVVSDIEPAKQRQLRFLSGYRFERWRSTDASERVHACSGDSAALSEWARRLQGVAPDPLGAMSSALWWNELVVDTSQTLTMSTIARAA